MLCSCNVKEMPGSEMVVEQGKWGGRITSDMRMIKREPRFYWLVVVHIMPRHKMIHGYASTTCLPKLSRLHDEEAANRTSKKGGVQLRSLNHSLTSWYLASNFKLPSSVYAVWAATSSSHNIASVFVYTLGYSSHSLDTASSRSHIFNRLSDGESDLP